MQAVYRLRKNAHFEFVYKKGKSAACRSMILIFAKNRDHQLKVGFSVSKKIGKSVVRNRCKRRMKEAFRQEIPRLSPDFHFVVIARPALTECSFADVRRDLRYLFKKAGVLLPAAGDRS